MCIYKFNVSLKSKNENVVWNSFNSKWFKYIPIMGGNSVTKDKYVLI